jgi:hypothetical protein
MNSPILRFFVTVLLLIHFLPLVAQQDSSAKITKQNDSTQSDTAGKNVPINNMTVSTSAMKLRLNKLELDSISMVEKTENLIYEKISLVKDTLNKSKLITDYRKRIADLEKESSKIRSIKDEHSKQKIELDGLKILIKTCQSEQKVLKDSLNRIQDEKARMQQIHNQTTPHPLMDDKYRLSYAQLALLLGAITQTHGQSPAL